VGRSNITGCNFAVSTLEAERAPFWTRYAGDGESGLAHLMGESFAALDSDEILEVSLLHPGQLPPADVVKLDVEGAELDIIQGMDLSNTSLLFLEYQNARNRDGIKAHLDAQFRLVFEDSYPWDALLAADRSYRRSLSGDEYGHLCFANRAPDRMKLSEDGPELITPIAYPAGVAGRIAARLRRLLQRPGSRAHLNRGSA
jgi:hypothetical protein